MMQAATTRCTPTVVASSFSGRTTRCDVCKCDVSGALRWCLKPHPLTAAHVTRVRAPLLSVVSTAPSHRA
jgi:hypothetical protein